MVEAVLVLDPEMLVVAVTLFVGVLCRGRHLLRDTRGIVPNETLEQLVSPADTNLITLEQIVCFRLGFSRLRPDCSNAK